MREEPFTIDLGRLRELTLTGAPPYREGAMRVEKDPFDGPLTRRGGFPGNAQRGEAVANSEGAAGEYGG